MAITRNNGVILSDLLEKKIAIPDKLRGLVDEVRSYMDNKRDLALKMAD